MADRTAVYERQWVSCDGVTADTLDITVMTYNVLSDHYLKQGEYFYCPEQIRYENSRGPHVIAEVEYYDPDVVCFQEVSETHFSSMLLPCLEKAGYTGCHMTYTNRPGDGLSIFYRRNKLTLEETSKFQAVDLISDYAEVNLNSREASSLRRLSQKCGGLLVGRFKQASTNKVVTIGNTHVTWTRMEKPGLQTLEVALSYEILKKAAGDDLFIYCGDFNSPPTFEPYQLLSKGIVQMGKDRIWYPALDVRLFQLKRNEHSGSYRYDDEAVEISSAPVLEEELAKSSKQETDIDVDTGALQPLLSAFSTEFAIKSAYDIVMGKEPEVTNCDADGWPGYVSEMCLDYLWYATGLQATRVLEPPARMSLRGQVALPNIHHPSDHIPLVASFKVI